MSKTCRASNRGKTITIFMHMCNALTIFLYITTSIFLLFLGIPLVYELDAQLKPVKHYYLADEAAVKAAIDKVAAQGKAKK